ncbi:MAG: hypothetical protein ACOYON_01075 [Fimbriimonas sp.]
MVELFGSKALRASAIEGSLFQRPTWATWAVDAAEQWAQTREFRRFHNGGLTLFERRPGPLIQEITMQLCGTTTAPRAVFQIYVSHAGLANLRGVGLGRLGHECTRVASGDLGAILQPNTWALIHLDKMSPEQLQVFLEQYVGPWMDCWMNPLNMLDTVFSNQFPLVGRRGVVEWILVEFGPSIAERYLAEVALSDEEERHLVADSLRRIAQRDRRNRPHALAELMDCYGLRLRNV